MAVFTTGGRAPDKVNYVEYIQSSGTQYIDTGFKPNNNTRVVMDCVLGSVPASTTVAYFGGRESADANNYAFMWVTDCLRSDYNNSYAQTWPISAGQEGNRRVIDKNKETTTVDGTSQSYTNTTFQSPVNMLLLANNNNGTVQWKSPMALYSCKIYDNGTLIRDFRPCLDPDGVACLYDRATKEYYYNAGTGVFTAG